MPHLALLGDWRRLRRHTAWMLWSALPFLAVLGFSSLAHAQSWSLYDSYSLSYSIPFALEPKTLTAAPNYADAATSMWLQAQINLPGISGGTGNTAAFQVDTGSTGMVVPAYLVPGYTAGTSQKVSFSSSGNYALGTWATMNVTFIGATPVNGVLPTATLPVFIEVESHNGGSVTDCKDELRAKKDCIFQLGIGYDRGGVGDNPKPTSANNPLLNIAGMTGTDPTMRAGYVITSSGVQLGLTSQNAGSGFSVVKLSPSTTLAGEWQTLPGQFYVNGQQVTANNTMLLDSGLSYLWSSLGGTVTPSHANCPSAVTTISITCAPSGVAFTVVLGAAGNPYTVSYSYVEGSASNSDIAPWYTRSNESTGEVNTGVHVFAGFSYFYDAVGGYVGLSPQAGAEGLTFQASLAVTGQVALSSSFSSDIPVYVAGNTQFSNPDMAVFSGAVSGGGALDIAGPGTVMLTSAVTLPAGIQVTGGGLSLAGTTTANVGVSTGAALTNSGRLTGNVINAGTFTNATAGIMTGALTNSGTTVNYGTISGNVANTGTLSNDGTITGTVTNAATLLGSGTITGNLVSTAQITPGHSIGIINVGGNITLAAGSVYTAEIGPGGTADLLAAGGTITSDGSTLRVVPLAGFRPTLGSSYTLMTAGGGVSGSFVFDPIGFGTSSSLYPFLLTEAAAGGGGIAVTLVRSPVQFANLALTPNQRAAAMAADRFPATSPLAAALAGVTLIEAPAAFTQLEGDLYASAQSVLLLQSTYVRNAVTARLLQNDTGLGTSGPQAVAMPGIPGATLWGQAYAGWGSNDGNTNAAGISSSIGGFIMGLDTTVMDWRLGLAAGFGQSSYSSGTTHGGSDNYDLLLYAARSFGPLSLRFGAGHTWHDLSASRTVVFPAFAQAYSTGYGGGTTQVFGEIGYAIQTPGLGVPAAIEPFAGLSYANLALDSFSEGLGAASVNGAASRFDTTASTLGLRGTMTLPAPGLPVTLTGLLGWQHGFGDLVPTSSLALAGLAPFTVSGVPLASDMCVVSAGLSAQVTDSVSLGVSYSGQFAQGITENALKGNFVWSF